MKNRSAWTISAGLALLYLSAFLLPKIGGYWHQNFLPQLIYPSLVGVLVLTPAAKWFLSSLCKGNQPKFLTTLVISLLCLIACLSIFSAAGYSALDLALSFLASNLPPESTRWLRTDLVAGAAIFFALGVSVLRRFWIDILRFLAILGFAFTLLAAVRLETSLHEDRPVQQIDKVTSFPTIERAGLPGRHVIWIIMDELDYDQTLGLPGGSHDPRMPNLERLAKDGVSALNAFSPAKDTVASIPALLTGFPISGLDFRGEQLWLRTKNAGVHLFGEPESVFGRLPLGPRSAAILGYYHPYCSLFSSVSPCISQSDTNVGRWFDAILFFSQPIAAAARWLPSSSKYVPESIFRTFEPMFRITQETIDEFPRFLAMPDKSLVFIHVNLPHPPGDFSQRLFKQASVGNETDNYRRNLRIVDKLVGDAVSAVSARAPGADYLLILSSDHWHRVDSPMNPQRIPWIAWHVGESNGQRIEFPINTVHTADFILAFLDGRIDDQSQFSDWWKGQSFNQPLMPSGYSY